ncbi:MAG TPA: hypothetical protein PKD85_01275, partial [Saprospiraceae bacterium]|nr:hypothetical protein [Saprospiraceae bacterium]
KKAPSKKKVVKSESEESSDEEVVEKKSKKAPSKKKVVKSESEESSDEEVVEKKSKKAPSKKKVVKSESEESSDEEVVEKKSKKAPSKKKVVKSESEESSDEEVVEKKSKKTVESSESESSEEPVTKKTNKKKPTNDVYKITTEELLAVVNAVKNSKSLEKDLIKKMQEYKVDLEDKQDEGDIEVHSEVEPEPLRVQYDDKLKVYTNGLWVFDVEGKKVFAKVKKGKIVSLSDQDLEILEDPPIENMGVLSKDKLQKMLAKQSRVEVSESEGDDDGKDIVEKVEEGVKEVMDEPDITEEDFLKYLKAQEEVEHKADYVAVSKAAGLDENLGRFIALQFNVLKDKYAKSVTSLKTKKSEGRKLRKK